MSEYPGSKDGVTRRDFVKWTGVAAGAALAAELVPLSAAEAEPIDLLRPDYATVVRRSIDQCVLTLRFYNVIPDTSTSPQTMTQKTSGKANYLAVWFGGPTYYAPQHVAEAAFPMSAPSLDPFSESTPPAPIPLSSLPIGSHAAGPSRLVFRIPDSVLGKTAAHPLTLDTASLLNWIGFTLNVVPNAVPPFQLGINGGAPAGIGAPQAPGPLDTAIEMPTGLIISPPSTPVPGLQTLQSTTVFTNATAPVTHNGWTELWHTRLAVRHYVQRGRFLVLSVDEDDREARTIRAVWAEDGPFATDVAANTNEPGASGLLGFRSSLVYRDRLDIVRLSSDFTTSSDNGGPFHRTGQGQNGFGFIPAPATVDNLMLSALGGWLDSTAHWDLPNATGKPTKAKQFYNSSLLSWRHRSTQGRDSYVRVVRKGFLMPWGHRASLITVTEREPSAYGKTTGAFLRQKTFIVVSDPIKTYGGAGDFAPNGGRKIPFTSVEAVTLVTPDLTVPKAKYTSVQNSREDVFEPHIGSSAFHFHFRGIDHAGDPVSFSSPVLWVDDVWAYSDTTGSPTSASVMTAAIGKWNDTRPAIALHNQRVSVAPPKDPTAHAGDTQIVATSFLLGTEHSVGGTTPAQRSQAGQPDFYPSLHSVVVAMPEAKAAAGSAVSSSTLEYASVYLANGFTSGTGTPNVGGIYLSRPSTSTRHTIRFHSDRSGGAITPNLNIDGLSREIGPASGSPAALAAGSYDPVSVFDGVDAKLLGGIELSSILHQVDFGDSDDYHNSDVLSLTSLELPSPHRVVTTMDWHPTIKAGGPLPGFNVFVPTGDAANSMDLHAVIVTALEPAATSSTHIYGQLRDFELDLFGSGASGFMVVPFDSLTFHASSGKKTDVDVQIGSAGVQFVGALSFVQTLADYLSFDGSGLVIDTSGDAITARLTLAIPSIAVGVFGLENIAFSAGVAIPYNGDPVRFDFAFCSRENPFALSIMVFTGGGFVGIGMGVDGLELLEFGFDFGLGFSIDIGIASGQVSLVGGVSYESQTLPNKSQEIDLTAYVKASGGISALGLVSVSVELYLGLDYYEVDGQSSLAGTATLTISVHIIFFGFSVGFSMHEQFAGSGPSPSNAMGSRRSRAIAPRADDGYPDNSVGATMSADDWAEYCTSFALLGLGV